MARTSAFSADLATLHAVRVTYLCSSVFIRGSKSFRKDQAATFLGGAEKAPAAFMDWMRASS
jgi:hypothetical protein